MEAQSRCEQRLGYRRSEKWIIRTRCKHRERQSTGPRYDDELFLFLVKFGKLCEASYNRTIGWAKWYVLWADEHVVAKGHADSNYRLSKEALLSKVPIMPNHMHLINNAVSAEEFAEEYEFVMRILTTARLSGKRRIQQGEFGFGLGKGPPWKSLSPSKGRSPLILCFLRNKMGDGLTNSVNGLYQGCPRLENCSEQFQGARGSGVVVRAFQHNMPSHLEKVWRKLIAEEQPSTHRPRKKINVMVESIYSREGKLCKLPEIVAICKKLKAHVYLDKDYISGFVGKTRRGVCELLGVDTADVDIMVGTFTKSFESCNGYIAGSKELIKYLNYECSAHFYAISISPPAAQPIIYSIQVILREDDSRRELKNLQLPTLHLEDNVNV